jgi:disulfide oxidoreductase YuzD
LDTVDGIINGANLDISGLHVTSHSESGGMSFLALNDYLKKHPEIENTSLVVLDGYHVASNVINTDNLCDELINRQVPVYIVEPSAPYDRPDPNDLNNVGMTNALQGIGFNTTYVKLSSETDTHHDNIFIGKVVNDGLCRYLAGVSDELLNSSDYRFTKDLSMYQNDFNNLFPIDDINRIIPFYNDNDGIMY